MNLISRLFLCRFLLLRVEINYSAPIAPLRPITIGAV